MWKTSDNLKNKLFCSSFTTVYPENVAVILLIRLFQFIRVLHEYLYNVGDNWNFSWELNFALLAKHYFAEKYYILNLFSYRVMQKELHGKFIDGYVEWVKKPRVRIDIWLAGRCFVLTGVCKLSITFFFFSAGGNYWRIKDYPQVLIPAKFFHLTVHKWSLWYEKEQKPLFIRQRTYLDSSLKPTEIEKKKKAKIVTNQGALELFKDAPRDQNFNGVVDIWWHAYYLASICACAKYI